MLKIDGNSLTLSEVAEVARQQLPVGLSSQTVTKIQKSRQWVEEIISTGKPVYGINTGFGAFADRQISTQDSELLSRNLILSHAVGTGPALQKDVVRAAMLIRANTLAKGHSGVRLDVVNTLLEMLNKGLTPVVPSQGSLGSSGDLAPLSHLALVFTTDQEDKEEESGWAEYQGRHITGKKAMEAAGIPRLILKSKEGLAINNGATFSAAIAALVCEDAVNLLQASEIALAMSLEAMLGVSSAFDPRIHEVRHHPGQIKIAKNIRKLTEGSELLDSTEKIQDAYSLRCAPQVHGPVEETLAFVKKIIAREINAVTDNPLLFDRQTAISGGNFHGEPVGLGMDYLSIALTEIAGISERRIFRLTDSNLNADLPPMLVNTPEDAGLNSGMMMPQYTAASLVLENRSLASPDSTNSLPTSAEQEDHNANSMTAARHTQQIVKNTTHVVAIELYTAARALDIRLREKPHAKLGKGTQAAYERIRSQIPYQPGDAWWGPEIETLREMVEKRELVSAVQQAK
ncbi:MAG: histidine ammonia-lyase [Anaerolineales bacterium]